MNGIEFNEFQKSYLSPCTSAYFFIHCHNQLHPF